MTPNAEFKLPKIWPHIDLELLSKIFTDPDTVELRVRLFVAANFSSDIYFLGKMSSDTALSVRKITAQNRAATPFLEEWARQEIWQSRQTAALSPHLPREVFAALAGDEHPGVQWALASNPATPGETLQFISNSSDLGICWAVARNPRLPSQSVAQLFALGNPWIQLGLVQNPSLPPEQQIALTNWLLLQKIPLLSRSIARTPSTSPEVLANLANQDDPSVVLYVAIHPNSPADLRGSMLKKLKFFRSPKKCLEAAQWPYCHPEILAALAQATTSTPVLLEALAANPSTPKDALVGLVSSYGTNSEIGIAAMDNLVFRYPGLLPPPNDETANLTLSAQLAKAHQIEARRRDREAFLSELKSRIDQARSSTSPTLITERSNDPEWQVRRAAASNPNIPEDIAVKLSKDAELEVRCGLARNRKAPEGALLDLVFDPHYQVRREVARNPSTPVQILEQLADDPHFEVRGGVARNPSTPQPLLHQFAFVGQNNQVIFQLVENPKIPVELLTRLADWEVGFIARSAKIRLNQLKRATQTL